MSITYLQLEAELSLMNLLFGVEINETVRRIKFNLSEYAMRQYGIRQIGHLQHAFISLVSFH